MRRARITLQLLAATLTVMVSVGSLEAKPRRAYQRESVAEAMRELSTKMIAAYEKRDTAALKKFYAKQPGALFFWERQMKYSWDQIETTMNALVTAVSRLKLVTTDFRSGGSGQVGWFAATFHIERETHDGQQSSSDGRWTVIAEKVDGQWLIQHEHTSFPLPKPQKQ